MTSIRPIDQELRSYNAVTIVEVEEDMDTALDGFSVRNSCGFARPAMSRGGSPVVFHTSDDLLSLDENMAWTTAYTSTSGDSPPFSSSSSLSHLLLADTAIKFSNTTTTNKHSHYPEHRQLRHQSHRQLGHYGCMSSSPPPSSSYRGLSSLLSNNLQQAKLLLVMSNSLPSSSLSPSLPGDDNKGFGYNSNW